MKTLTYTATDSGFCMSVHDGETEIENIWRGVHPFTGEHHPEELRLTGRVNYPTSARIIAFDLARIHGVDQSRIVGACATGAMAEFMGFKV